jgi:hypothetical protein
MSKINIPKLQKLIKEVKMDRTYHDKFIKNFKDVREEVLTEQELNSMADHLYELIAEENKP